LSAIIFNALIVIGLIPPALSGVAYRPIGAGPLLRRNLLVYGLGGIVVPVAWHQGHRSGGHNPASRIRNTTMVKELRPAIILLIALTPITGLLYPVAITGVAQVLFPYQANGSLNVKDGNVIGSELIGRLFADAKYFHGRPSGTTKPDPNDSSKTLDAPYNAANSAGANLGPTNKALIERVKAAMEELRAENPTASVPIDLVATSGSGLDPDISPAAALFQVTRVAEARNMPEDRIRDLVNQHSEGRMLDLIGEPRVNVLNLKRALDRLAGG